MKVNTHILKKAVTALCVLSLSPTLALAGGTPKSVRERGIIKSVDMSAHTLVVTGHKKNVEQKFQWNDRTKFREHNGSVSADALKAGEHVNLTYTAGGSTPTLQSVHIAPAKMRKHSASHVSPASSHNA